MDQGQVRVQGESVSQCKQGTSICRSVEGRRLGAGRQSSMEEEAARHLFLPLFTCVWLCSRCGLTYDVSLHATTTILLSPLRHHQAFLFPLWREEERKPGGKKKAGKEAKELAAAAKTNLPMRLVDYFVVVGLDVENCMVLSPRATDFYTFSPHPVSSPSGGESSNHMKVDIAACHTLNRVLLSFSTSSSSWRLLCYPLTPLCPVCGHQSL